MRKKLLVFGIPLLLCAALIALAIILPAAGKNPETDSGVRDTPVRIGTKGQGRGTLLKRYDLESAVADSDIVADLTIRSWAGENPEQMHTLFNAGINALYKGDCPDKIFLMQSGTGEMTYKDYPLFKIGDRLLVFLKKAAPREDFPDDQLVGITADESIYDNAYWIIGAYTTVMDIQTIGNTAYAMDRMGILTENTPVGYNGLTYIAYDVRSELRLQIKSYDPILSENVTHRAVFLYDEITQAIRGMVK